MNIAHFLKGRCNPDSANGVEKTVYHLCRQLAALGHQVLLQCETEKEVLPIPGVVVRNYAPALPLSVRKELFYDLQAFQPDVVHLHSAYVPSNASVGRYLRRHGVPYAITPNGNYSSRLLRRRPALKMAYKQLFELPLANRACFVHSVGDTDEIRRYGVSAPIVTAPNGIDLGGIPAPTDHHLDLSQHPSLENKRILAYVGRLDVAQKGLDLLLRGFATVVKEDPSVGLLLVGPDWHGGRRALESLANELGITKHIVFWGPSFGEEKYAVLRAAAFFVHTSRWEGLPLAVLEALAVGLPTLLTPSADPFGLVGEHEAGVRTEPSSAAISAGLRQLFSASEATLATWSERARALAEREFNWTQIAATVSQAYATHVGRNTHV